MAREIGRTKQWGLAVRERSGLGAQLAVLAGSYGSIIGLVAQFAPDPRKWSLVSIGLVTATIVFAALHIVQIVRSRRFARLFVPSDESRIASYMNDLLINGGRSAIWTRDLSWAQHHEESRQNLKLKASRRELIICAKETSEFLEELRSDGAEVFIRGNSVDDPKTRFTIVQLNQAGSMLAVGGRRGGLHAIEEFDDGDHFAFEIATDLINLARSMPESRS